jgi:hypothetical protein
MKGKTFDTESQQMQAVTMKGNRKEFKFKEGRPRRKRRTKSNVEDEDTRSTASAASFSDRPLSTITDAGSPHYHDIRSQPHQLQESILDWSFQQHLRQDSTSTQSTGTSLDFDLPDPDDELLLGLEELNMHMHMPMHMNMPLNMSMDMSGLPEHMQRTTNLGIVPSDMHDLGMWDFASNPYLMSHQGDLQHLAYPLYEPGLDLMSKSTSN